MKLAPALKATAVVIVLAAVLAFGWFNYRQFLNRGRQAPESAKLLNQLEKTGLPKFELKDLNGADISLATFSGKVVILNFWASWCDPCVSEFPSLISLIEKFKGEVVLIAVSADYERKDIDAFVQLFKVKNPFIHIAWDKDLLLAKQLGTNRLPESYIVGRDGHLIRKVAGVDDWASGPAFEYFSDLIKK